MSDAPRGTLMHDCTRYDRTLWNMLCKLYRCEVETDGTIGIQLNLRLGNSEVEN